jgi:RNA polymerase sigma factor (sigma-70 family)
MNGGQLSGILSYLQQLGAEPEGLSDGQLLERFASRRDEDAFAALLRRHGPLVWGVCRRVLRQAQDAEDAFQATFLVLARRAGAIRKHESVRSWLYGVAHRVAVRARDTAARRHAREGPLADVAAPADEEAGPDPRPVLDEEIGRLPEKYRLPLILCHLEGKSQEQAAQLLGCPRATVATRLVRGRERLRDRLVRRGLDVAPTVLFPSAGREMVPPALAEATLQAAAGSGSAAAAGTVSARVAILTQEVLQAMLVTRWKTVVGVILALAVVGSGAGVFAYRPQPAAAPATQAVAGEPPAAAAADKDKPAPAGGPAVPAPPPDKRPEDAVALAERLSQTVEFPGFEDPNVSLQEALDFIADRYDVTVLVNEAAFKAVNVDNVLSKPVAEKPFPKMKAALAVVLQKILARVSADEEAGAIYLVRRDVVEITTRAAVRHELRRGEGQEGELRPLLPLVVVRFEQRPLAEALQQLAASTGYSIVVDGRAADKGKTPVSATLTNVPLDTAVRVLADMADLKPVLVDNLFYVTTRDNAARFEADLDRPRLGGREMPRADGAPAQKPKAGAPQPGM